MTEGKGILGESSVNWSEERPRTCRRGRWLSALAVSSAIHRA